MTIEGKKTDQLISDAEAALPLTHADKRTEAKVIPISIKPATSVSGGFQMTEEEKLKAEADARKKIFQN